MRAILLFIIVAFTIPTYAGIYKWVDKHGQTHYSETPPDNNAKEMNLPPASTRPADNKQFQQRLQDQEKFLRALEEERNYEKKLAAEEEERQQQKKNYEKYCREMRHELRDMEKGGIVWYELDKNGERTFLSDKEVESRKQKLRDRIKTDCPN
ncbi:DUF4124 domain-containing protein [Kaarinaea lacus]